MRHHNANRKLGREKKQRVALLRTLAVSLIDKETIKTTDAKARELRPFVEKLVTKAKSDTVSSRKHAVSVIGHNGKAVTKLFKEIGPRYEKRSGGYTRIIKTDPRKNDASKMAYIQFV